MRVLCLVLLFFVIVVVRGDIYAHNPRGSNDRARETDANRQNANRLFNSQNNAKGGYSWGPAMTYYEGSVLPLEWTAQHGCGSDSTVECNMIIQYMCTDPINDPEEIALRDGTTTTTITDNANTFNQKDASGEYTYGMHESYKYYQDCKGRERNKGLYIADQNLNGNSAQFTRQTANGAQYGFECNEERDYYPYWHPSPWKDIAILPPNISMCEYYQSQSQNVVAKGHCSITATGTATVPNNQPACVKAGGSWLTAPAWGIAPPVCQQANYSRDNHLGNVAGGGTASYSWIIPSTEACSKSGSCDCAIRYRYNISNANVDNWGFDDYRKNGANASIKGDPTVIAEGGELTMAVNTAQFGRTFQDRSLMFHIATRPAAVSAQANIYNLNVRGKRGNIVETFPATEYDFVPNNLRIKEGDYVHFQWTGSDTNPQNNEGEGKAGTDRSNIVQIASYTDNLPLTAGNVTATKNALFEDANLRHHMAFIGQTNCPTQAELLQKNGNNQNNVDQDATNCAKLNAGPAHFDAGPVRINKTGKFFYMSTRNNNFSNRSQKGTLIVDPAADSSSSPLPPSAIAGIVIGCLVGVLLVAFVVLIVVAKKKPHSGVASMFERMHMPTFGGSSHSYASSSRTEPLL